MRLLKPLLALALTLASLSPALHAQRHQHGLVLKSGELQPADQWTVNGDRVHYHSSERNQWEDIPSALIDWDATAKNNAPPSVGRVAPSSKEIDEYNKAIAAEEAAQPTVAPGLRLPENGGVLLLDTFQNKPELVELTQSNADVNKQTGKNLLRATVNPLPMGSRQTIELKGARAAIEAHVPDPVFYISLDQSGEANPNTAPDRFTIVRVRPAKNGRTIASLNYSLTGKPSENADAVPTTATRVGAGPWIKLAPNAPLDPGQYALVERLNNKEINMDVWDFGVKPGAPENHALYTLPPPTTDEDQPKKKTKKQ